MEEKLILAKKIIRRKAKRIERARNLVSYLESDIKIIEGINEKEKEELLRNIEELKNYLKNDDGYENQYNYDNANGYKEK